MARDLLASGVRILVVVIISFIVVVVIRRALNPLVRVAIREQMEGQPEIEIAKRISTLSDVLYRTLLVVIVVMAVMTILPEFGVNATALVAGLGLFGLAIGFGAQNLVKDMINGVFILVENQYGKGDVVTVSDLTGVVEDINLRRTVLRDLDGTVHFISHSNINMASNWTKSYSRVNLNVRVGYEEDLDRVIEVINEIGRELADDPVYKPVILDPPHVLRVDSLGESAVELKVIGETAPIEQWRVMGELRLRLKKRFDAEGINAPFPQRTLHVEMAEAAAVAALSKVAPAEDGNALEDETAR